MKSIYQQELSGTRSSFSVKEYAQPHFTSPYHFHDLYELILIANSSGKLYADNKILNFNAGDVYMFAPGFSHCFYNDSNFISTGEVARAIVIYFKGEFLGGDFFSRPELIKVKKMMKRSASGIKFNKPSDLIKSCFDVLLSNDGLKSLVKLLDLLDSLAELQPPDFMQISENGQNLFPVQTVVAKLDPVFKYVLENYNQNVNSKTAATLAYLNDAAFCRYFKKCTGKTFSQFVNNVRITHATQLLTESSMSIANICFECGYKNLSYFNREFKSLTGETPFDYRRKFGN